MPHRTLKSGRIGNAQCSLLEPVCQAVNEWMQQVAAAEAAQGFTYVPNRSEVTFTTTSMYSLRASASTMKYRPIIAADVDIDLDENMKTVDYAPVFIMATFENQPVTNIPELYRHFVRHTNSPDTPPWPVEGKDPIWVQPAMRHSNQYVLVIPFKLPPGTKIRFHEIWDPEATAAKYSVTPASLGDLQQSYPTLLEELPPELASAKIAKRQARQLIDSQRNAGCEVLICRRFLGTEISDPNLARVDELSIPIHVLVLVVLPQQ